MKLRMSLLLLSIAIVAGTLWAADDVWEKKSSAEWSAGDARKIMEDSPWAGKWVTVVPVIEQTGKSSDSFDRDTTKEMWYRAQFWSAMPIREARVRAMQIQGKYNEMTPEQKKTFDENAKQFIEAPQDAIVIRITYGSNVQDFERKMTRFWHEQTTDLQKNLIVLVADGKRIPIQGFQLTQAGSQEFYISFPRVLDGAPVIAGPNSKVGLELQHPDVAGASSTGTSIQGTRPAPTSPSGATTAAEQRPGKNGERVFIQFKPAKMTYHGQLTF